MYLKLDDLMSLIYTDMRALLYGPDIISDTTEVMGGEVSLDFVDIPMFRRLVMASVAGDGELDVSGIPTGEMIITNLHEQSALMLSVLLNIEAKLSCSLFVIDDFGTTALDYATKLQLLGGHVAIEPVEGGYRVFLKPFDQESQERWRRIYNYLIEYECCE